MKIRNLKLANAIKCGSKTEDFLNDTNYEITLVDSIVIKIVNRRNQAVCYTTLMNTVWWHPVEEPAAAAKAPASKAEPKGKAVKPTGEVVL